MTGAGARDREWLVFDLEPGVDPAVGVALAALADARRRTLRDLAAMDVETLDRAGPGGSNSIGAILYHVAAIEMAWLYEEILEADAWAPELDALLPHDVRDEAGLLTAIRGEAMERHLVRLHVTREQLVEQLRGMDAAEFRRVRRLPAYDVTPEFVVFHLTQHEAEHRSEIWRLRAG